MLENVKTTNQLFTPVSKKLLEKEKTNTKCLSFKLFGEHLQSPCDQPEVLLTLC